VNANSTPQSINIDGLKRSVSGVRAMFEGSKSSAQQERPAPTACKSLKDRMAGLQTESKPAVLAPAPAQQVRNLLFFSYFLF
jgi:hypothetical protein